MNQAGWKKAALSLEAGIHFLLKRRSTAGWWTDFRTPAGESDEWVTAYVAWSLSGCRSVTATVRDAAGLLLYRDREPGWAYNRIVPADCDSTAWVVRLARSLGMGRRKPIAGAIAWLHSMKKRNGWAAFPTARPIRRFTGVDHRSFDGWTSSHVCVTANVLGAVTDRGSTTVLRKRRNADGSWNGYWWTGPAFPTMLACCALGVDRQAHDWAARREGGSEPFALACRARISDAAVGDLLEAQQPDGSWPSSARLRIPSPDDVSPGPGRESLDQNRVFTTATAVRSLHEQLSRYRLRGS